MKKDMKRFVSAGGIGINVIKSQCVSCKFNKGINCSIFGTKLNKYASVQSNTKCPKKLND